MNINDFLEYKKNSKKISMLTCYDYWSAKIVNNSQVDCLLVGDSLSMVMHGETSTLPTEIQLMASHTAAVRKGAPDKFIVGDLPFLSYRGSLDRSLANVGLLMKAGAQAVKMEGIVGNESLIQHLVPSGVPVMAHLGLTPQSVHTLGGYKVQGREADQAQMIFDQAIQAQELGCFALVLECVPTSLAERITNHLEIPTIGIGAGPFTDGQVLVMQDMLGGVSSSAKFVRQYMDLKTQMQNAFDNFDSDVKSANYPNPNESYNL